MWPCFGRQGAQFRSLFMHFALFACTCSIFIAFELYQSARARCGPGYDSRCLIGAFGGHFPDRLHRYPGIHGDNRKMPSQYDKRWGNFGSAKFSGKAKLSEMKNTNVHSLILDNKSFQIERKEENLNEVSVKNVVTKQVSVHQSKQSTRTTHTENVTKPTGTTTQSSTDHVTINVNNEHHRSSGQLAGNESVSEDDLIRKKIERYKQLFPNTNCTSKSFPAAILVGVAKCGTGSLGYFLSVHPQIVMQLQTGYIGYFDKNYQKGPFWYLKQLPCSSMEQITIEKTNSYFRSRLAPQRIRHLNKNMKILMILRDPVERSVSQYLQMLDTRPHKVYGTFEDIVYDNKTGQIKVDKMSKDILNKSKYSNSMRRWLKQFPLSQIHVIDSATFRVDPVAELQKVEEFLGLEPHFRPEMFPQNDRGFHCLRVPGDVLCMTTKKGRKHPTIDPNVTAALEKFYKRYNVRLSKLLGRTFEWMKS